MGGVIMSNDEFQKLVLSKLDKLDIIEKKVDENKQILNALEHRANVASAELDKISVNMAHVQGDIKSIKADTDSIKNVLSIVEQVTAQNWVDISKMKKAQ